MRSKEVQIIPWVIPDSNYVRCPSQRLEPHNTVFVGALHGMLNAEGLAHIFNDLFGGVVYAGIDTDKHKYPIGNVFLLICRVICFLLFKMQNSCVKSEFHHKKFAKKHNFYFRLD